ncbi:arabinogalactan peptide-like protein [Sesbania bispinosa]|nr:arabinogalactan peptide-like protein [Sesbania bispinosa]
MEAVRIFVFPLLSLLLFMAISHLGQAQNLDLSPALLLPAMALQLIKELLTCL